MTKTLLIITALIFSLGPTSYGSFQDNDQKVHRKLASEILQLVRESHLDSKTLSDKVGMEIPLDTELEKLSNNQLRELLKALIPVVKEIKRKIKIIEEIKDLLRQFDSSSSTLAERIGVDDVDIQFIYSPGDLDKTTLNTMRKVKKAVQKYVERVKNKTPLD